MGPHWRCSQEPLLFNAGIAKNIAHGKASPGLATQEDIEASARVSNAYAFVMTFPDKFGTRMGARGVKLSCGQT